MFWQRPLTAKQLLQTTATNYNGEKGRKPAQIHPEPALGWVLIGRVLGAVSILLMYFSGLGPQWCTDYILHCVTRSEFFGHSRSSRLCETKWNSTQTEGALIKPFWGRLGERFSVYPVNGNPRTGLLRTFWERDRVLGSLFCSGVCVFRVPSIALSGQEKGVIMKGVFSLAESLESLTSLDSLENGRILLCFPQSRSSLETLESLNSLESLEKGLFWKDPFSKRPLFPNPTLQEYKKSISVHPVHGNPRTCL